MSHWGLGVWACNIFEIHYNILLFLSESFVPSLSFRFSHQNPFMHLPFLQCVSVPLQSCLLYLINLTI